MKKQRRRVNSRSGRGFIRLLIITAAIFGIFIMVDIRMRPVIENIAAYQARVFAMKCINDAIVDEMSESGVEYVDIVMVTQNLNGDIASIQSNMLVINNLKSRVTARIVTELQKKENQSIKIPLGSLIGVQFTSGRGPKIEIKIIPVGYVQTNIYNQFTSAGINQSLHQIMLEVGMQMSAIIPGYSITTETVTNYCIAETVIVGTVPDGYTRVDGDNSPTISKINDYKGQGGN